MASRLTAVEQAERKVKEIDLQRQLVGTGGLARILGWEHVHFRPGMRANGQWRTSTSGSLAHWPDLVLVRIRDRRLIFAELKRQLEQPSDDQAHVLDVLRSLDVPLGRTPAPFEVGPRVEVHVWRPSDLRDPIQDSVIYQVLR